LFKYINYFTCFTDSRELEPNFLQNMDVHLISILFQGTTELIETDNVGSASDPQIAFDSSGNAIAVWIQSGITGNNIWANRFQ